MLVLGLSGVTNGGKTTLSAALKAGLEADGHGVLLIHQDDHFRALEDQAPLPELAHQDWDRPEAVDFDSLWAQIHAASAQPDPPQVLIIEGFILFHDARIRDFCRPKFFLTLEREECKRRRSGRTDYEPPDVPGYFEDIVWPAYEVHLTSVKQFPDIHFVDGAAPWEHNLRVMIMEARRTLSRNWIGVTHSRIDEVAASDFLRDNTCGAISLFYGTTRDTFEGRSVVSLEYEAYDAMAVTALRKLAAELQARWPDIAHVVLLHRLGLVSLGETSVVIGVSSPHRATSLEAVAEAIERLKADVPVWKKERYADGHGAWKENQECGWANKPGTNSSLR